MVTRILLIPLLPLISFALIVFFGKWLKKLSAWLAILASASSCALALHVVWNVIQGKRFFNLTTWLVINKIPLEVGIAVDPLAAMMLFVVTFVGTLIIIYSVGYMHEDLRYPKFFAYLSLFMFSMLGLVISPTLVQIYVFWELVGLCSYFLIGFWFEKKSASDAGRKAFITNRIGDIGFFLGIASFFYATGTMRFADITPKLLHAHAGSWVLMLSALLLFCGAVGKSAQFPLHVWLPDAMEGPTPVSALIHAATMVAAGVYLVARLFPLFHAIPDASRIVGMIGTITAFMAAFFALTQMDIKRVLAYSTISQLGYMMAAIGMGGMTAGTFHLMTHAFFKALLFLGAGSVIHGSGVQDMKEMGGLKNSMPVTFWTFLIATIAIAGIPPFSGFWSKDEILASALDSGHMIKFWILAVTAAMTSFYMFRLLFLTFFGKTRGHGHAHESPWTMTFPLIMLAVGSIGIGFPGSPFMHHWFQNFISQHHEEIQMNSFVVSLSIATSVIGFLIAFIFYIIKTEIPVKLAEKYWLIYAASKNKLWIDEFYQATVINWFKKLSYLSFRFDEGIIDRIVNEVGWKSLATARIKGWIDAYIVDGLVNLIGWLTEKTSSILRYVQTGYIHHYLFFMILGLLIIVYALF
jgi:NADH-quinone oxidoreductase subunit L